MTEESKDDIIETIKQCFTGFESRSQKPLPECINVINTQYYAVDRKLDQILAQNVVIQENLSTINRRITSCETKLDEIEVDMRNHDTRIRAAEDYIYERKREAKELEKNKSALFWRILTQLIGYIIMGFVGYLVAKLGIHM